MSDRRPFRRVFGPDPQADVDAEFAFHLEMRAKERIQQGDPADRAREAALQRFGDYDHSRNECVSIDERRRRHMERTAISSEIRQDLSYTVRMLRRTPGFTLAAILTLALGIGANSAIFSVVHGVLLMSVPYPDAERLIQPQMLYPDGTAYTSLSAPDFMSVRERNRVFDRVEAYTASSFTLTGIGEPQEIRGGRITSGLFDLLGMSLIAGRGFSAEEHQPGRAAVAVLDHGFWQRALGGDAGAVGKTLRIGGAPFTIVGILGPGGALPDAVDVYAPLEFGASFSATTSEGRRAEFLDVIARVRPGTSLPQAQEDLRRLGSELQKEFPDTNGNLTFTSATVRDLIVGDVQRPLFMLMGAVAVVLLVACANVASLLLARASSRQAELAVRAALGAGRARLFRQLLTEAVVLGVGGGLAGLALAYWATRALVSARPADLPRIQEVGIDGTVVVFTFAVSLLTAFIFGLLPALQLTGRRLSRSLREGGRSALAGASSHRLRSALVVTEMALCVVLLMGAGLLIRSFVKLTSVDPGFRPDQGIAFRVTLQGDDYSRGQQIRDRVAAFEARLRALPGVSAVASTNLLPLSGLGSLVDFQVLNAPPPPPGVNAEIAMASVSPDYFQTVGITLQRGRGFTAADHDRAPRVAVINEAAVRRWFPDRDPIGGRVEISGNVWEVVGVIRDVRQRNAGVAVAPQLFAPYAQQTTRRVRFVVRAAGDPMALAPAIRAELRALDPNLAVADVTRLEQLIATSVARPRFYMSLLALFAAAALVLAATGIFGVMSYAVAQRSREISIRMALGARRGQVLGMIVGKALSIAAVGAILGVAGAVALGRVIQNQLYEVRVMDPATLGGVVAVLLLSALAASFLPARRASSLDPAAALRES